MIQVADKFFDVFISAEEIQHEIKSLAAELNRDYAEQEVVFLSLLNGSFMFSADILKSIQLNCEISFLKLSSYSGTESTGKVEQLIGLTSNLRGKHVVVLEDIVDSGLTIDKLMTILEDHQPESIKVCTLLFKPDAFKGKHKPEYVGFSIPNAFVVGYGLDYNEKGRNLSAIYQINESKTERRKMLNIVLFGPPGAGKGTQSEKLIEKYGLIHLSTGDIFRANMKNETELGLLAKSYIDKGQLVPDEVTIDMLKAEVKKQENSKGFIFDGFPRTNAQAKALDQFLTDLKTSINGMISLDVEEVELRKRLALRAEISGRTDDADPTVIQKRIDVYKKETAPVKDYYSQQNKWIKVNGLGSIEEITSRLFDAVESLNGVAQ